MRTPTISLSNSRLPVLEVLLDAILILLFLCFMFLVNALQDVKATVDPNTGCTILNLKINNEDRSVTLTPFTLDVMLQDLKKVRNTMQQLFQ